MTSTTEFSPVDRMYVDSIHVTAIDRDWSEGYGETWDFIEAPECGQCGTYARWISGDDLAASLTDEPISEDRIAEMVEAFVDETWESWRCPNAECENYGVEIEPQGDEGPMMNYSYALPSKSFGSPGGFDQTDAEKIAHLPLCIVTFEDSGDQALALTGGGMDLSWEIAEAFMRLGHLPPLAYCDLPVMAGMDMSERRRWVLAGALRSCEVAARQAQGAAESLRRHFPDAL